MPTEQHWVDLVEKAREEIRAAPSDREALILLFTELARLILDIKFGEEA